jgi:hypothetical protein
VAQRRCSTLLFSLLVAGCTDAPAVPIEARSALAAPPDPDACVTSADCTPTADPCGMSLCDNEGMGPRCVLRRRGAGTSCSSGVGICDKTGRCVVDLACRAPALEVCAFPASCADDADCDDGNPCTADWCDEETRRCEHGALSARACHGGGSCSAGACCPP